MDAVNHSYDYFAEQHDSPQPGHWLPALRPDFLDESHDDPSVEALGQRPPIGFVNEETHIIPPSSKSDHDSAVDYPVRDAPAYPFVPTAPISALKHLSNDGPETNLPYASESPVAIPGGDELPSEDDDERLDPSWGFNRVDSAHILDTVHRSTTFPPSSAPDVSGTQYDADILNAGLGDEADIASDEIIAVRGQDEQVTEPQSLEWTHDDHDGTRDPLAWTTPGQEQGVDEIAQRFDEGLPLIQAEERQPGPDDSNGPPAVNLFDPAPDDEEAAFFANVNGNTAPVSEHPSLERKSTSQVLDSLSFPANDTLDSPPLPDAAESSFFDELAIAHAPDNGTSKNQSPEDVDAMWAAALEDDEFLVEDADDLLPDSEPTTPVQASSQGETSMLPNEQFAFSSPQRTVGPAGQQNAFESRRVGNPYAPHQPSVSDMIQLSPTARTTHNTIGLPRPDFAPMSSLQEDIPQRPAPQTTKSFADQAKDGYKSPYDLPMEISKPRKRQHVPQPIQTARTVTAPPRSSSLSEKPLQSPFSPSALPPSRPGIMHLAASSPAIQSSMAPQPAKTETPRTGTFFEELPITVKPRSVTNHGRYTPQQTTAGPPPPALPQSPPSIPFSPPQGQSSPARGTELYDPYQLRAPERLDPYANVPLQPPPPVPAATTRYSPAPGSSALGIRPGPSPRYSPAPPPQPTSTAAPNRYASLPPSSGPSQPPPMNRHVSQPPPHAPPAANMLPFQPRTSSPLAFHRSSIDESANDGPLPMVQSSRPVGQARQGSAAGLISSPPMPIPETGDFVQPTFYSSPPKHPGSARIPAPRRSQTQSPSKQRPQAGFSTFTNDILNRPASAYGQAARKSSYAPLESVPPGRHNVQPRGYPADLEYVQPVDDTQFDPLERWKGAPVFKLGFGGSIISTFPKHVPRYTTGAAKPQIKAAPGEMSIRTVKDILPQSELMDSFPGPLRSKSKKKDVLAWMSKFISELEASMPGTAPSQSLPDAGRRHLEKILLWKIVCALVENDGVLEGPALKSINLILSPEVHALDEATASQYPADEHLSGIYRPSGTNVRPDPVDPMAVEVLRKRLLSGDRQAAVIHAMDNRLWSHALVISSTMDRSMWSQVVREFVRQEVKTIGENSEPLSALYEVFGGNLEESIDELVPPSARAGLQMVSKVDTTGPTKNALEGLNRWKETLSLILNNRSQGDHQALTVLGKLLEDYNRIEAAHICYLFSRNPLKPVIFGGFDEEHTTVVLLGANHKAQPTDFGRDQEAILLTEVFEFATSVLASGSPSAAMPHLSVYKLQRAILLSEGGRKVEAQSYCDAIAATFKSNTKFSSYHHPLFLSELDDLSNRLKQTPIQGSSSWMGKPSLEKVSGSMWNKFSSFVAGEDSDAESKGSGKDAAESGPFAKVSGTPSISRSGSQSDLYGAYTQSAPTTVTASRYAPNGVQSARSSAELTRGRPSLDSQRSPPSTSYSHSNRQYEPMGMLQEGHITQPVNPYQAFASASPQAPYPQSPPRSSYAPNNVTQPMLNTSSILQHSHAPTPPAEEALRQPYSYDSDPGQPPQNHGEPAAYGGYEPPQQAENLNLGYEPSTQSYGYEPPADTGYVPYMPEPDSPVEARENKPKKKSFMDDDDDDNNFQRMSAQVLPPEGKPTGGEDETARKRANDAAADAAFRAAAEADAAHGKEKTQSKRSSSWFGGWLGGKKPADGLDEVSSKGPEPKIYRANLGESKMKLYYDKDLGKWVNPDNPDVAQKTATPPPPRMNGPPSSLGGPPRVVSIGPTSHPSLGSLSMGPDSVPSSRSGTPAGGHGPPNMASPLVGLSGPPSGSGTPPLASASTPGLAPPMGFGSRPGTATSNTSSIDDLIGPPMGRKGAKGGKKGAKSGRYVDVMAK